MQTRFLYGPNAIRLCIIRLNIQLVLDNMGAALVYLDFKERISLLDQNVDSRCSLNSKREDVTIDGHDNNSHVSIFSIYEVNITDYDLHFI